MNNETPKRLAPTSSVLKKLFALSGNVCAMPDCKTALADKQGTILGEVAHIKAALPGGQRFDASMSNEQRRSFDNLLILCATHHKQVDGENSRFTVENLEKIKADHESHFACIGDTILAKIKSRYEDVSTNRHKTKPNDFSNYIAALGDNYIPNETLDATAREVSAYVEKLSLCSINMLEFLSSTINTVALRNLWANDGSAEIDANLLSESIKIDSQKMVYFTQLIEKYGLLAILECDAGGPIISITNPSSYMTWGDIYEFCSVSNNKLSDFALNLEFGLLG